MNTPDLARREPGWKLNGRCLHHYTTAQRLPPELTDARIKPESLEENLTRLWSRRINREHRLVYMFEAGTLYIVSCRYHY